MQRVEDVSQVRDINDYGELACQPPLIWRGPTPGHFSGAFGFYYRAINNLGQKAGYEYRSSKREVPIVDDLYLQPLGRQKYGWCHEDGEASDINNHGDVVGWSGYAHWDYDLGQCPDLLFLYSEGEIYELDDLIPEDSEWLFAGSRGYYMGTYINDNGWITGRGNLGAFLLKPIPEPATLGLLLIGGLALLRRRRSG